MSTLRGSSSSQVRLFRGDSKGLPRQSQQPLPRVSSHYPESAAVWVQASKTPTSPPRLRIVLSAAIPEVTVTPQNPTRRLSVGHLQSLMPSERQAGTSAREEGFSIVKLIQCHHMFTRSATLLQGSPMSTLHRVQGSDVRLLLLQRACRADPARVSRRPPLLGRGPRARGTPPGPLLPGGSAPAR